MIRQPMVCPALMVPLQSFEKERDTLVSADTAKEPGPNLTGVHQQERMKMAEGYYL